MSKRKSKVRSKVRQELWELITKWQSAANKDPADSFKYEDTLEDILYHADYRFVDYNQFQIGEGPFPLRLKKWLDNLAEEKDRKALFRILRWLIFLDNKQMKSLYRDAFRSRVRPWICNLALNRADLLSPEYYLKVTAELKKYHFRSITESFNGALFKQANSLQGLPKIGMLGEKRRAAELDILSMVSGPSKKGLVIFEDVVGTGKQAGRILETIAECFPRNWRCLFVPLIVQEKGLSAIMKKSTSQLSIQPIFIVPNSKCVQDKARKAEPDEFKYTRGLVKKTASRVTERLDEHDDPPRSPFGYENSGALLVTSHNCPNNSLPLFHHRAPEWTPLFRRIHHSKDS